MTVTADDITRAYKQLDYERMRGDELQIDLAQAALDDLLDRFVVTVVTRNEKEEQHATLTPDLGLDKPVQRPSRC